MIPEVLSGRPRAVATRRRPTRGVIARYRDWLPVADTDPVVTLGEGSTPLVEAENLSDRVGGEVWVKVEGCNPTGSFKDRGMTVALSVAAGAGARAVVCASTGNTSASASAYAVKAGLLPIVLLPAGPDRPGQAGPGDHARGQGGAGRGQLRPVPRAGPQALPTTIRSPWSTR